MSSSLLRPLRTADAERVAALFDEAFGAERTVDAEEIRSWLRNEELEPDWLRVLEAEGTVIGYGDIWPEARELTLDVAAPGSWEPFFEWAEAAARERSLPRVCVNVPAGHEVAGLAEARGYRLWRSSFTMQIELAARPAEPALPAGLTLRTYGTADAELVQAQLNAAFSDDVFWHEVSPSNFREFYLRARGFDPSLWLLAFAGPELAGSVLAYPQRGGDTTLGRVGTLGVRREWRRRGLGATLLQRAFAALYDRGLSTIGLGVDAENPTGALGLYERAGMRKLRQSDNWVLDL
jgi:ribosomal protein S18 acetylase RimI-like enzyme